MSAPTAAESGPAPRLLCLPFAGAGAGFFNAWRRTVRSTVRVVGIKLPGREDRLLERPARTVSEALAAVRAPVRAELDRPGPLALFGHSMGAVLAYELARWMETEHPGRLSRLFVSGAPSPWDPRPKRASGLPDAEFLVQVERFAGFSHVALAEPAIAEMIMPVLRADVELHEAYEPGVARPLPVPITAFRGSHDDLVSVGQMAGWARATSAGLTTEEFPGTHMYLLSQAPVLLAAVERHLLAPSAI